MSELITIIVPVYKVEDYLNRCVDSILKQTYENLEIILVNDGSPDGCKEICDEYAKIDSRIKVIHKENGGLSDARNTGIENTTGSYITFIDSDDWIQEEYVEVLYNLLVKNNADISVCNFQKLSSEKITLGNEVNEIIVFTNYEALKELTGKLYVQMVIACGKLYKSCLFDNVRFPIGRIHEDEFTTYKLIYKAKKVVYTSSKLLLYWQREDSIMGSKFNSKSRKDAIDAFNERALFFEKMGLMELSNKTYIQLFFIFIDINMNVKKLSFEEKKELELCFSEFYENIKKRKFNFKIRMFFELYYRIPKIMNYLISTYINLKLLRGEIWKRKII